MKLKVVKDNIDDPSHVEVSELLKGYIKELPDFSIYATRDELNKSHVEVSELLKGYIKELPDLSGYATKEEVTKLIEGVKSLSILLHQGVFDLVAPINITSFPEIEQIDSIQEGVLYWDSVNKRGRLKTEVGWKTVKLE